MIVISGALVLVALVLLVVGLTMTELTFVFASIAVSLLAFVFLIIGILQRRGEPATGATGEAESAAATPVPAGAPVDVSKRPAPPAEEAPLADLDPPVEDDDIDEEFLEGGIVLVVAGRPRYHVDGCRYLNDKDVEEMDVFDAQDDGFTPCGVCKPDEALAAELEDGGVELVEEPFDEAEVEPEPEPAPTQTLAVVTGKKTATTSAPAAKSAAKSAAKTAPKTAAKASAKTAAKTAPQAAAKTATSGTASAPAKAAAPDRPPLSAPPTRSTAARSVPAAAKSPGRGASVSASGAAATAASAVPSEQAAPAAAAPKAAAKKGSVVVIPDRGRFHQADCRYVRGVDDALELTRAQATKQGYDACGVCKP